MTRRQVSFIYTCPPVHCHQFLDIMSKMLSNQMSTFLYVVDFIHIILDNNVHSFVQPNVHFMKTMSTFALFFSSKSGHFVFALKFRLIVNKSKAFSRFEVSSYGSLVYFKLFGNFLVAQALNLHFCNHLSPHFFVSEVFG